ncbi:ABC transporter ATP-binding protein [Brevibacillus reuszeri]|uniref:ABC transporter ATP-binding protein n=1 Tax=Brevibacillus reuszeri TaxID=54915 RepID=UPI003D192F51
MHNWKWMWSYVKQCKTLYFVSIVLWLLESVSFLLSVVYQQKIIDDVIINGEYSLFWGLITTIIILFLAHSCFLIFGPYLSGIVHSRFRKLLIIKALKSLYNTPVERLYSERTGWYMEKITNEVPAVAKMMGEDIPDALKFIIHTIIVCIIIGFNSMPILFGVLLFSILFIFMGKIFGSKQKSISEQIQIEKSNLTICLEEGVESTREVIAFNSEKWELEKYTNVFKRYYKRVMSEAKLMVKQILIKDPITWGGYLTVLIIGGYQVLHGQLSIGFFVVIYQLTSELMMSCEKAYNFSVQVAGKMAFLERVRHFFEEKKDSDGLKDFTEEINTLALSKVCFQYDERNRIIINECDLTFPIGNKIALVGGSGSGKSTIALLLIRFLRPNIGSIIANDIKLEEIKRESWAERIGIVFQEPYLFHISIKDNLLMGLQNQSQRHIEHICKLMCIHDDIIKMPNGYDTIIGERGITLSGGQKQRLSLARSILRNPEILILDEATSALDRNTEYTIQKNLDQLRQGRTTIIIAHRLSTIINSDIIYVLKNGRVVERGTHTELLQNNYIYKELSNAETNLSIGAH